MGKTDWTNTYPNRMEWLEGMVGLDKFPIYHDLWGITYKP